MQNLNKLNLNKSKLPQMLGELMHSNQFLKMFSVSLTIVTALSLIIVMIFATREPLVITLDNKGHVIEKTEFPKAEDQIKEAINHYLDKRYHWEPENVVERLKESEVFIAPKTQKAFREAVMNVSRFSTDKNVSQKIYPEKVEVNLKQQTALITGDRVTSIQGLKAAGNLKLELTFEMGSRTEMNPWGIYISKEREE